MTELKNKLMIASAGAYTMLTPMAVMAEPSLSGFQSWLTTQVRILAICVTLALSVLCVVKKEYAKLIGVLVIGGFITILASNTGVITTIGNWVKGAIGV